MASALLGIYSLLYKFKFLTTNLSGRDNITPYLLFAAESGDLETVQKLIDMGITNHVFFRGHRPLYLAAQNGHTDICNLLLAHTAITCLDEHITKTLIVAAQNGHKDILEALLSKISPDNEVLLRCIYIAAQNNHNEVIFYLLKNYKIDLDSSLFVILLPIISNSNMDALEYIISKKVDLNKCWNKTPIANYAANIDNSDILATLIKNGANINIADSREITPIMIAAYNGNYELVKLLIECSADINKEDMYENSPLFLATKMGHLKVVELLLEHKANFSLTSGNGLLHERESALYAAVENNLHEILELFLKEDADPNYTNTGDKPLLYLAAEYGHKDSIDILLKYNANPKKAMFHDKSAGQIAVENGHNKIAEQLGMPADSKKTIQSKQNPSLRQTTTLFPADKYKAKELKEINQTAAEMIEFRC
ncbi:MAG: hypothetical protein HON55_00300 [Legionellales bacterium]|jgi:ankyrin repeat protein|nr:hypothetical protein [Legionellales bacterium]